MKNERLREFMFRNMITQSELAKILGVRVEEITYMIKYELSSEEQDNIIAKIEASLKEEKEGA